MSEAPPLPTLAGPVIAHRAIRALILTPSGGQGGGIERYVETLEWAFTARGVAYTRLDLRGSGPCAHARLLAQSRADLRGEPTPTRLVLAHRTLLPVARALARQQCVAGISVICHGSDVWGSRARLRRYAENWLMRATGVRIIAASSFTAGALARTRPAVVLHPGLSSKWFQILVDAAAAARPGQGIRLITVFRLPDWRDKGLPDLLEALTALGMPEVHLTVCGSGAAPAELQRVLRDYRQCTLLQGLDDRALARQLADADLFVLATRTRSGSRSCGEGFGLALLEAQVAGTPVVGPAHGGSYDAYLDQITGASPADETATALAQAIGDLLRDPDRLAEMGRRAALWSREAFAPERYAGRAVAQLFGPAGEGRAPDEASRPC